MSSFKYRKSMSNLDLLPEILFDILLSEWNGVAELTALDSAYCNEQSRPLLLGAFQRKTFAVDLSCTTCVVAKKWIFCKHIRPKGLLSLYDDSLWSGSVVSMNKSDLFDQVTSLKIGNGYRLTYSDELKDEDLYVFKLVQFLNMCPKLRKFSAFFVHSFNYFNLFSRMDQNLLKNMTAFQFSGLTRGGISMQAVNYISSTCTNLIDIEMTIDDWNEDGILELLSRNSPSLTVVSFKRCHLTERFLYKLIMVLSQRVKSLTLSTFSGAIFTNQYVRELLLSCAALKDLEIKHQRHRFDNSFLEVKIKRFKETNCNLFLNNMTSANFDHRQNEVLAYCPNNHKISLTYIRTISLSFISSLMSHNVNLHTISMTECIFGADSFHSLRLLFERCMNLNVIKMRNCSFELMEQTLVTLLSDLPQHVTTLLICGHPNLNLDDLLLIVGSNPHLETLWYALCKIETAMCDREATKIKIQSCGCKQLNIVDKEWPSFLMDDDFYLGENY